MTTLPMCRCLDCKVEFRQPWLNYVWLGCPKCRTKKKLPLKWEPPAPQNRANLAQPVSKPAARRKLKP